MHKLAQTSKPIHPLLAARWSPRAFAAGYVIPARTRLTLMEAARWAPSCFGAEPWFVICCDKNDNPDAWQKALDCLMPANRAWAQNASLLFLACAETHFSHNGNKNRHHAYDTGAAMLSLVLQCEATGLRAHQMGGFDAQKAREIFAVPDTCDCLAMVAIGKQAAATAFQEKEMQERENAPRNRKPLADNFFDGGWNVPVADKAASGVEDFKHYIRDIPDFPKAGILFRDITPLLANPPAYQKTLVALANLAPADTQVIAAVEARGFFFGAPLAQMLNVPFVPIRKPDKLPAKTLSAKYALEYDSDELHMHADAIQPGARVFLIDDLIATGGTMSAAVELVEKAGGEVAKIAVVIELDNLGGRAALGKYAFDSLMVMN